MLEDARMQRFAKYSSLKEIFKEFLLAIDMTAGGTPEEKLKWAFKMYDRNESGIKG